MKVLSENILRCMSAKDRKAIGQKSAAESSEAWEAKSEKELQELVVSLLRLRGIEVFGQRMDRKTRGPKGQPDLIFSVNGLAQAWECKTPIGKLSEEQIKMRDRMVAEPNSWKWRLIRSVDDARLELRNLGI